MAKSCNIFEMTIFRTGYIAKFWARKSSLLQKKKSLALLAGDGGWLLRIYCTVFLLWLGRGEEGGV